LGNVELRVRGGNSLLVEVVMVTSVAVAPGRRMFVVSGGIGKPLFRARLSRYCFIVFSTSISCSSSNASRLDTAVRSVVTDASSSGFTVPDAVRLVPDLWFSPGLMPYSMSAEMGADNSAAISIRCRS
jgi:hypothetical protein